jgi:hypothetical protein
MNVRAISCRFAARRLTLKASGLLFDHAALLPHRASAVTLVHARSARRIAREPRGHEQTRVEVEVDDVGSSMHNASPASGRYPAVVRAGTVSRDPRTTTSMSYQPTMS